MINTFDLNSEFEINSCNSFYFEISVRASITSPSYSEKMI